MAGLILTIATLVGLALGVLFGGWIIMLCLGALAHIFGVAALSIAFWPSCLVAVIISIIFPK